MRALRFIDPEDSVGMVPGAYNANAVVPPSVDYIRGTGGSGAGITLQLTAQSTTFTGPNGPFSIQQVYFAKKVDAGAGPVIITDSAGALFEDGSSSYQLNQQWQWAIFIWNGTAWEIFGGLQS